MRLVDLHCNWALQYAGETTQGSPGPFPEIRRRLDRLSGYLMGTSAAVLFCGGKAKDRAGEDDPWRSLADTIARHEAEFPGRLLITPADVARWKNEPIDGLCWGTLGIDGLENRLQTSNDLDRLAGLFERGIRVFQLAATPDDPEVSDPGNERGRSALDLRVLERLLALAPAGGVGGPRPVIDLMNLGRRRLDQVLDWFENDDSRPGRLLLVCTLMEVSDADAAPKARVRMDVEHLRRLRALGGVIGLGIGPPLVHSTDTLRMAIEEAASIPYESRAGYEGIGIGTDFLSLQTTLPDLGNVSEVCSWLKQTFGEETGHRLALGNAGLLLARAAGGHAA